MDSKLPIPVLTVIGRSGSGKTTLLEGLIPELRRRGYRIATVKHHSHSGFEIDQRGKDSFRHAQAGSVQVIIASPDRIASYRSLDRELDLPEILQEIHGADLILVEGYKRSSYPCLEVLSPDRLPELLGIPEQRIAIASDVPVEDGAPCFQRRNFRGLADLIESRLMAAHAIARQKGA